MGLFSLIERIRYDYTLIELGWRQKLERELRDNPRSTHYRLEKKRDGLYLDLYERKNEHINTQISCYTTKHYFWYSLIFDTERKLRQVLDEKRIRIG